MLKIQANRNARIQQLRAKLGDRVAKGDVLATLVSAEELNNKIITELTAQIVLLDSKTRCWERKTNA